MRTVGVVDGNLHLSDEDVTVVEKEVTRFGTGAKVDHPGEIHGEKSLSRAVKKEDMSDLCPTLPAIQATSPRREDGI